jgi:hypothetical protein
MRTRLHSCRDQVPVAGLKHRILQSAKQQAVHGAGNPIQAGLEELRELPGAIHSKFRLPLHHWGHLHLQLQIRMKKLLPAVCTPQTNTSLCTPKAEHGRGGP